MRTPLVIALVLGIVAGTLLILIEMQKMSGVLLVLWSIAMYVLVRNRAVIESEAQKDEKNECALSPLGGAVPDQAAERKLLADLASYVRNNPSPVLKIDYEGKVIGRNEAAKNFCDEDPMGKSIREVITTMSENSSVKDVTQIESKLGERLFLFTFRNVEHAKAIYIYGANITKRRKYEEKIKEKNIELSKALEKARAVDKLKDRFLTITSHELRTPLTPTLAQLAMFNGGLMGDLSDEQKDSIGIISKNLFHLDEILDDILDIVKLESGQYKMQTEYVEMGEIIQKVIEKLRPQAEDKRLHLVFEKPHLGSVNMHVEGIQKVLRKLIQNAIEFSQKGDIVISGYRKNGFLHIGVRDQGEGIDKEHLQTIFSAFTQADDRLTRDHEGAGLGLAVSDGIVKKHGGNITVESKKGEGSYFEFTLPLTLRVKQEKVGMFKDVAVVRNHANIKQIFDFKGKRISDLR